MGRQHISKGIRMIVSLRARPRRARLRRFVGVLSLIAVVVLPFSPAEAGVITDGSTLVHAWTVNLHQSENNSKFVAAVSTYNYKPDIIMTQEIKQSSLASFASSLNTTLGWNYGYQATCEYSCGLTDEVDNAIFYRTARLTSPVKDTWASFAGTGCALTGHSDEIAVKFNDSLVSKTIVAASVHWAPDNVEQCLPANLTKTNDKISALAPGRRMSLVGGDFNSHPDSNAVPDDAVSTGYETNPDCWWRLFNAGSGDNAACGTTNAVDTWHDSVKLYTSDICNEWTHGHGGAKQGTSCTGTDASDGTTANRDRGRLDLLWVRWTNADGTVQRDPVWARSMIVSAGADTQATPDAAVGSKYSDHRAVHAVLKW
jgi:endonuclease/exonuclease/phosphatase (EEP) superfamily protein YafD